MQEDRQLNLNRFTLDRYEYHYTMMKIRQAHERGRHFEEVTISHIEPGMYPDLLNVLQVVASKPITKLSIRGLFFDDVLPDHVERFVEIIRVWVFDEVAFYASPIDDSWYHVIARGLVNKPIGITRIQFISIPRVNLCDFDLPGFSIPSIEFYGCGVIVPQPLRHMQCQRLLLNRVDDSSLINIGGLIGPNFELGLVTDGVSDALNEILALNKISVLRLDNTILTKELLNGLVEGIMKCKTLTTIGFYRIGTGLCDVLWKFFEKIKSHEKLQELIFPCNHDPRCYDIMKKKLERNKGIIPLFELLKLNHYSRSTTRLPRLPVDVLGNIKSFLVPPNTPRPDLPDDDTFTQ